VILAAMMAGAAPSWALAQTNRSSREPPPASSTVEQLVALAFERAPDLQAQRLAVDRARGDAAQAALRANPMLSGLEGEQVGGPGRMTSVMVDWRPELFRRAARMEAADRQVAVAEANVAEAERRLAAEVRRRAIDVLAAAGRAAVVDDTAASLHKTYELLRQRVDAGAAPPLSRDQAYVEWQRAESQRPMRRADVSAATAALRAVVGLPADAPMAIADRLEDLVQTPISMPTELRSDLRQASAMVASTAAIADRARQDGRFDLGLTGGYSRTASGFPQLGLSGAGEPTPIHGVFHSLSFGISVTLPIANRNQGSLAAALSEARAAEFREAASRLDADAEVAAARARDAESQAALEIYDQGLRATARKNLEVVRESFALGRLTLADVFDEERRVFDVELDYVNALNAAALARADLLFALGVTR
jgi:cobalt-zinc-cadmium efflux system outer membrane protein